jgi:hypothetical protein
VRVLYVGKAPELSELGAWDFLRAPSSHSAKN